MLKISFKLLAVLTTLCSGSIVGITSKVAMAKPTIETKELVKTLSSQPATANLQSQVPTTEEKKPEEKPAANQFSINTKLQGQVIFGVSSGLSGDLRNNVIAGQRTRLELATELGSGTLTTRLQIDGVGTPNSIGVLNSTGSPGNPIDTPEGSSSFGVAGSGNSVALDLVKYDVVIGPNTQLTLAANAAGADDFTDSINPYFDGDGGSGSISRFGNRPSIYYLVSGTGAGIRHKFSPVVEGSIGYLSNSATAGAPGVNSGFGSNYGAIAQITFNPNENTKLGLTYVNASNTNPDTGSANANPGGSSNMFGVQGSFKVSPKLALGGWIGYNRNSDAAGDRDIINWAVTAAFPDLGGEGNLGGLLIGQEPRVTGATGTAIADSGSSLHLEGFYQVKLNDNLSITPGLIYLTAPDHNSANNAALIGTIRTTFSF
jgi:Carbohydrate-selective porin, OprB family